ncbi:hypothetical protein K438DRAFT_1618801, partial [Mycena galopus ATCC 62051]
LVIGTWANSFLYMAELIQAWYYFSHFKYDDWKLKTLVSVAILVDTVSVLGDYACVYLYTITHAGDPVYLADQHWPIPLHIITTDVIAVMVQSFLISRYWRLCYVGVCLLTHCMVPTVRRAQLGGSFACAVTIVMFPAFKERWKAATPSAIWLVTEAVADTSIAVTLLLQLRKARPMLMEKRRCGIP